MTDLLTAYAASQPDKIAVIDDRGGGDVRKCTYAELEARANQVAHVLTDLGAGPGSKIAWCGQNSTGIVEAMNAARKIRATAVPINYRLSDDEAAYVVDHCDAVGGGRRCRVRRDCSPASGRTSPRCRRSSCSTARRSTAWSPATT